MIFRILFVAGSLALTTTPSLACEVSGLTEAIDTLKGGNEPAAGVVARACVTLIENKDEAAIVRDSAGMYNALHSNFDKNPMLKDAIDHCSREMLRQACRM